MNAAEAIDKALPVFLQCGNLDDEDLVNLFIREGFDRDTARKIVIFMPLAFGRVIINELRVNASDEFEYLQKKELFTDKQIRKLNDVEVYRKSFDLAFSTPTEKRDEKFFAVAFRSAEVNAVHQMQLQGSQPENIVLTRMLTMWEIDEEAPQDVTEESTQTKNWWQFWK